MLFLVVLAGQTIVTAAIVIAGSVVGGRWRCGRQSECPRGDGDQGPQGVSPVGLAEQNA